MNTVSSKTCSLVKSKVTDLHTLPVSGNLQLEIPPLEQSAKPEQIQDLQTSDPGAPDGFALKYDIAVLCGGATKKHISLSARFILGIIMSFLGKAYSKYLLEEWIAQAARCSRQRVSRRVKGLEAAGLLNVVRRGKCHRYHVPEWVKHLPKTWVNPALVRDTGLSILQACDLSDLKFRQGDNDATWPTIQERAKVLGVSYHSIARADTWLAALGYIQRRHRPWRRSSKNEYALTYLGKLATGVSELESARPKRNIVGQTRLDENSLYANCVRKGSLRARFSLSFDSRLDQEPQRLLRSIGIAGSVARSMAVQWRGDCDSVKQIIINAAAAADAYHGRMRRLGVPAPRFNLAGYVVAALNGARSECHGVQLSKLARAAAARNQGGARAAASGGVTDTVTLSRREEQKRRLFSTPVKHTTPDNDAESAITGQQRSKTAVDAYLTRTLQNARRHWAAHHKPANLAHKLGFSADS